MYSPGWWATAYQYLMYLSISRNGYKGNALVACRRGECFSDSECASHLACFDFKCQDPCNGACGRNTQCQVKWRPFWKCPSSSLLLFQMLGPLQLSLWKNHTIMLQISRFQMMYLKLHFFVTLFSSSLHIHLWIDFDKKLYEC